MGDHGLILRRDAAQATLARFEDQPFAWGRFDCAKMLAFHLRGMGISPGSGKAGSYSTAIGARRALTRLGVSSLADLLDRRFERIAPAAALVGDVVALPSTGKLDAIGIVLGNGRLLAYHEDAIGAVVVQPLKMVGAWRIAA